MSERIDWKRRWPLALAGLMVIAALATLFSVRSSLQRAEAAALASVVQRFEANRLLGRPESLIVSFDEIERIAASIETDPIRRVHVAKLLPDGRELVVRPFYLDLTQPNWRETRDWLRLPIGPGETGFVYIDRDRSRLLLLDTAMAGLATLLVGGVVALIARQRKQEIAIDRAAEELAKRKAQVIQLERLALAGQLSANIFHDIKKPVLNIKHEVADAKDQQSADHTALLTLIQEQTELFLQILRELGLETFVNARDSDLEWCDLLDSIQRSQRLVRYEQQSTQLELESNGEAAFLVRAQPHRLVQLFSNLLLNAFQALDGRGVVRVSLMAEGSTIRVLIEDSGPGIPDDRLAAVFEPFVTSKSDKGGSGLGLFICRTIAQDLGGDIVAGRSENLGGARFQVTLPGEVSSNSA